MKIVRTIFGSLLLMMVTNLTAAAQQQLTSAALDSALGFVNLSRKDFYSDRIWVEDDTFLLPRVRDALSSPIEAYNVCREFASDLPLAISHAANISNVSSYYGGKCTESVQREIDARLAATPPLQADPFEPLYTAFGITEKYRTLALIKLSAEQQQALLMVMPLWFEDEDIASDDTLKGVLQRAFGMPVDTTRKVTSDSALTLLALVDRDALATAAYAFARGLALTAERWRNTPSPFMTAVARGAEGLVLAARETPYGTFVLGGSGPNVYTGDFALIIDLGGDDRYASRCGSAIGGIGHSVAAVVDMKGNDAYLFDGIASVGCGILGFGALVDGAGNDIYRNGLFSQGSAFCGAGLLFDGGGNDLYQAGFFSQGAATCGAALLVDSAGRDVYDLTMYGQGFASTFGAAALVDGSGNDVYRAGGLQSHAPLRPEDYRSFAQGFSIGVRPRAGGGIAVLLDKGGNDFYNAEIYAQGVAYWYSLAGLIDEGGNDSYSATQYVQGAGIHLAAGVLEDVAGDDRYGSRFGPGQGGAHDLSVGFFYDHGGDDQYIISGGQGTAINNSASLFVDEAGNDQYATQSHEVSQGAVRDARGFGNLAAFVDAEGTDTYPIGNHRDSSAWFEGSFAIGYDVPFDSTRPRETSPEPILNPADTLRSVADLFREASLWEVTDNREKVRRARLALNAKGIEAVRWVGQNKLDTDDALERRAITEVFKQLPDSAVPYLLAALNSQGYWSRRNAISIAGEVKIKGCAPAISAKLGDADYARFRPEMLRGLGEIGDKQATNVIQGYAQSVKERERLSAIIALGKLQDSRAFDDLVSALSDTLYSVRSAAVIAVAQQGADIVPPLNRAMARSEATVLPAHLDAVRALAVAWRSDEKKTVNIGKLASIIREYVDYPDAKIQASALRAARDILTVSDLQKLAKRFEMTSDPLIASAVRSMQLKMR